MIMNLLKKAAWNLGIDKVSSCDCCHKLIWRKDEILWKGIVYCPDCFAKCHPTVNYCDYCGVVEKCVEHKGQHYCEDCWPDYVEAEIFSQGGLQ